MPTLKLVHSRPRDRSAEPRASHHLLSQLCREPHLLAAFREDPEGTARRLGVELGPEALDAMVALEADAVTDVVLDAPKRR
jgi:hypothetical protein